MSDDIVTRLRAVLHNDRSVELMNREAADKIERLRAERDEARQEVCRHMAHGVMSSKDYAKYLNWDCFKGDK